jgi:hypothetical protein
MSCMSCSSCDGGTDPFTRIGYFYKWDGSAAEVADAGVADPWSSMDVWVDEAAGQDGHRTAIDAGGSHVVGFGHGGGTPGACWKQFDVGDLAGNAATPPSLAAAAPKPIAGPAGSFRIYATWNDPVGGAPHGLAAVVDGKCVATNWELGDPKLNATYYADVPLTAGCHAVYVLARDAQGTRSAYPSTTAFTIPVAGANCPEEAMQAAPDCGEPLAPLGGGGNRGCACNLGGAGASDGGGWASGGVVALAWLAWRRARNSACKSRDNCQH